MADEPWVKPFPHPTAEYIWDALTESWVPQTVGEGALEEGHLAEIRDELSTIRRLLEEIIILMKEAKNVS